MRLITPALLALLLFLLAACGQKGALYLPQVEPPQEASTQAAPSSKAATSAAADTASAETTTRAGTVPRDTRE
ncbi:MAG: lipoprotein [Pseudomonadota bacterium]